MAVWETRGFERGWGGTGRTFLSHYKHLEPLGKHPTRPPARTLGPAARVLLAGRCCTAELQPHPRPPPSTERDEVPGKTQPEPQMLWLEAAACPGRRWLHAAVSPRLRPPVLRARERRERRAWRCGDVFCSSVWCSQLDAFPLSREEVWLLCALTSNRALQTFLHPAVGHGGLGPSTWQVVFLPSCSSSPIPSSFLFHYLIGLPILPQISELLSKAVFLDTWK